MSALDRLCIGHVRQGFLETLCAVVVLVLAQTYCSFMSPWIVLLFAVWVLTGSKLT